MLACLKIKTKIIFLIEDHRNVDATVTVTVHTVLVILYVYRKPHFIHNTHSCKMSKTKLLF